MFILQQKKHFFYKLITFLGKTLIPLLTSKLITVDSKKPYKKFIRLSQMFEPEQKHHQMQMLILNQPRLKTWLFSNTVASNNGVFKGKVFEQNETLQPIEKVINKILIRKQNYAYQQPNNNMQSLDYITQ